jgi:hypothetical protein
MQQFLKLSFIFLAIAVLPACGPHYKKRSLSYLQQATPSYKQTQDNVTLEVTKLGEKDTGFLFDGQGYKLKNFAQPLYIRILNNSDHTFLLDTKSITMPQISIKELHEKISYKKLLPITGIVGASTLYVPLLGLNVSGLYLAASNGYVLLTTCLCVSTALLVIVTPFIIPVTIISGCKYSKNVDHANYDLHEDIHEKVSENILKIPADTMQEFLFFADAKQFKNNFNVTLNEKITNNALTFNVTL